MKFLIKEISSTKTEVRLSINPVEVNSQFHYVFGTTDGNFDNNSVKPKYIPFSESPYISTGPNPAIIRLLVAYLKDFIGSPEASRDYMLITEAGIQIPIVNIAVDDINLVTLNSQTLPTILIKLAEELPGAADILQTVSLEKQIFTTQEQNVYYIPGQSPTVKFFGLDYDEDSISRVTTPDTRKFSYDNYNELTSSFKMDDLTVLHKILSQSEDNLKIDYSEFGNHVYYGSAVSKLKNFENKVKNIENEINFISQSLQLTGSDAINTLRIKSFNKIQEEKSSFTNYERNLYYNSGLKIQNVLSVGSDYKDHFALNSDKVSQVQNEDGFHLVYKATGSDASHINLFTDKYKVEKKPFYNSSGSFYLSFLVKGDETINDNITWENRNQNYIPKLPYDTLYTSSLLQPNIKSGSWVRHIYHASMSYFAPAESKPSLGYANSITDFGPNSSEVNVINSEYKSGSYSIRLGSRYSNLATSVTSSGIPFTGSIVPTGELFRIGIDAGASSELTSSYITDVRLSKENPINYKPFMEVFSTGSDNWTTWYENQYASASDYDDINIYSFYNNLPQYIVNNSDNDELKTFISMLGEHFDYIKAHIDNYRYIFNTGYDTSLSTPDKLLPILAKSAGWDFKLPFGKSDDAEVKNYLGTSMGSVDLNNSKTIMNNIWRNILNHLPYIYKSKGTINSISLLLNSYGIPSSMLKIREHGASLDEFDKSILSNDNNTLLGGVGGSSGNASFGQKTDKLVSYLIQSNDDRIETEWGRDSVSAKSLEFVFKPNMGNSLTNQTIVVNSGSAGKHLWQINLEPSGSTEPTTARLHFQLSIGHDGSSGSLSLSQSVSASTDYLELVNGENWNVLLQKTEGGDGDSDYSNSLNADITQSYQLLVGKQNEDIIDVLSEATLNVTQGDIGTRYAKFASANFVGTGSRHEDSSSNFVFGTSYTGSIAEIRTWTQALSQSKFKQHILDKRSVVGNTIDSSRDELIYHYKLNENYISGSTNLLFKDSNPNNIKDYTINWVDSATGSLESSPSYVEDEIERIYFNVRVGGGYELDDNTILIDPHKRFTKNLNPTEPSFMSVYNPLLSKRKASSILELVRSPQDVINDFITSQLANFDFNDKFSDPRDIYKGEYTDLKSFSDNFFLHYNIHLNVNKYITAQADIFNSDLIDSLKRLVPARASFGKVGVELKPTYLDRQKLESHKLERELIDINSNIPLTDWDENKYTHTIVEPLEDLHVTKNAILEVYTPTGSSHHTITGSKIVNPATVGLSYISDVNDKNTSGSINFENPQAYSTKDAELDINDNPPSLETPQTYSTKDGDLDISVGYDRSVGRKVNIPVDRAKIQFNFIGAASSASKEGITPTGTGLENSTAATEGHNSSVTITSADGIQKTYRPTGSVGSLEYDLSASLNFKAAAGEGLMHSIQFGPDGTQLFAVGVSTDSIYEYSLEKAYEINSGSDTTDNFDFVRSSSLQFKGGADIATPIEATISPDGLNLYVLEYNHNKIHRYSMSTPWSITSGSGRSLDWEQSSSLTGSLWGNTDATTPSALQFKPDGTRFFTLGASQDAIYEYSLSTPWDISSGSDGSMQFVRSSSLTAYVKGTDSDTPPTPFALTFKPDGTKFFMSDITEETIYEYSLARPWDITSGSAEVLSGSDGSMQFVQSSSLFSSASSTSTISPYSITFSPDGTKLFVLNSSGTPDKIHQYNTAVDWNITSGADTNQAGLKFVNGETKNGSVLFHTGSNPTEMAGNFLAAVTSSEGHSSASVLYDYPSGSGHNLYSNDRFIVSQSASEVTLIQKELGTVGNTSLEFDGMFSAFISQSVFTNNPTKAVWGAALSSSTPGQGIPNLAKITLTAADGDTRTFMALSSSINGTWHAVSQSVLFATSSVGHGLGDKASTGSIQDAALNLLAAITSSAGFGSSVTGVGLAGGRTYQYAWGGKFNVMVGNYSTQFTPSIIIVQQNMPGTVGNTPITVNDQFTSSFYDIGNMSSTWGDGTSDVGKLVLGENVPSIYTVDPDRDLTGDKHPSYGNPSSTPHLENLSFYSGDDGNFSFRGGKTVSKDFADKSTSGPIIMYSNTEEPKPVELSTDDILTFDRTYNDTNYVFPLGFVNRYGDETGSLWEMELKEIKTKDGDVQFENESFSDWYNRGFDDLDIASTWGTSSSDRHFIQLPTGSGGLHGDNNTYHYDNRYVFQMVGDVETVSGSYEGDSDRNQGTFHTDFTGTITNGVFTASKDFSNQTNILSDTGLGLRPLGTTLEFKASTEFTYGGKFLDENFVYPPNHNFIVGNSKDDIDVIYKGSQNTTFRFQSTTWTDISDDAFYTIRNTGGTSATVTYE